MDTMDLRINDIDPDLIRAVKKLALDRGVTLRQLVFTLLRDAVAKGERSRK